MNRFLIRIVAALLVPGLIGDAFIPIGAATFEKQGAALAEAHVGSFAMQGFDASTPLSVVSLSNHSAHPDALSEFEGQALAVRSYTSTSRQFIAILAAGSGLLRPAADAPSKKTSSRSTPRIWKWAGLLVLAISLHPLWAQSKAPDPVESKQVIDLLESLAKDLPPVRWNSRADGAEALDRRRLALEKRLGRLDSAALSDWQFTDGYRLWRNIEDYSVRVIRQRIIAGLWVFGALLAWWGWRLRAGRPFWEWVLAVPILGSALEAFQQSIQLFRRKGQWTVPQVVGRLTIGLSGILWASLAGPGSGSLGFTLTAVWMILSAQLFALLRNPPSEGEEGRWTVQGMAWHAMLLAPFFIADWAPQAWIHLMGQPLFMLLGLPLYLFGRLAAVPYSAVKAAVHPKAQPIRSKGSASAPGWTQFLLITGRAIRRSRPLVFLSFLTFLSGLRSLDTERFLMGYRSPHPDHQTVMDELRQILTPETGTITLKSDESERTWDDYLILSHLLAPSLADRQPEKRRAGMIPRVRFALAEGLYNAAIYGQPGTDIRLRWRIDQDGLRLRIENDLAPAGRPVNRQVDHRGTAISGVGSALRVMRLLSDDVQLTLGAADQPTSLELSYTDAPRRSLLRWFATRLVGARHQLRMHRLMNASRLSGGAA